MMLGHVNSRREAIVALKIRGPDLNEITIDAVIDTGFNSAIALPSSIVQKLKLLRRSTSEALLADGSSRRFGVFAAEVEWHGHWRGTLVAAVGDEPLIGMRLLIGSELRVQVKQNGSVEISPIP